MARLFDTVLRIFASVLMAFTVVGPAKAETRIVVRPQQTDLAQLETLRSQKAILITSMQDQYAQFRALKLRQDAWFKSCNKNTAISLALWVGNQAWNKVASKHAPIEIKGALKAEEWLDFVQTAFGKPSDIAEILGNNFKCRALVTEAYIGYYTRLKGLGITLQNTEASIAQAEIKIAGMQSTAPPPARSGVGLTSAMIDPAYRMCDGYVAKRCREETPGEASADYYDCLGSEMRNRMKPIHLKDMSAIAFRIADLESRQCFRRRDPSEWVGLARALRSGGY